MESVLMKGSVIPISDNGGSSSELIRVFGGPGIGDVRSKFYHDTFYLKSSRAIEVQSYFSLFHRFLHQGMLSSEIISCSINFPTATVTRDWQLTRFRSTCTPHP